MRVTEDNYIDLSLSYRNIDVYITRKSIFDAIKNVLPELNGKLLDIGCGKIPYKEYILSHSQVTEYIGVDIQSMHSYHTTVLPDYYWDGNTLPFEDSNYHCALATEVLEHVPDISVFLKETHRVLKANGLFFFTTPFLWPLHDVPYDEWRLTPFSLKRLLTSAGFKDITIKPLGGWHSSMAQMIGLWIKRAPKNKMFSILTYAAAYPFYRYLVWKDRKLKQSFSERSMFTGLYGIARKN